MLIKWGVSLWQFKPLSLHKPLSLSLPEKKKKSFFPLIASNVPPPKKGFFFPPMAFFFSLFLGGWGEKLGKKKKSPFRILFFFITPNPGPYSKFWKGLGKSFLALCFFLFEKIIKALVFILKLKWGINPPTIFFGEKKFWISKKKKTVPRKEYFFLSFLF